MGLYNEPPVQETNGTAADAADAEHNDCDIQTIAFTAEPALPELFTPQINNLLHLAGHYLADGEELPMLFVMLNKEGDAHLLDGVGAPSKLHIAMWVNRYAIDHNGIAILMMSESWSVPRHVMDEWEKTGRTHENLSEHPEAFESLLLKIETLNGTWVGQVPLSKYVEGSDTPRTADGDMNLVKALDNGHGLFDNLLPQNKIASLTNLPDALKEKLQGLLKVISEGPKPDETGSGDPE